MTSVGTIKSEKSKATTTPDRQQIEQELRHWYRSIPDLFNGAFRRTWMKALARKSMKAAIRAKCHDCMNWQNAEIRDCPIVHCPLYLYRPGAKKDGPVEREIARIVQGLTCDSCS
jgi:hypothetical protein